jgi:hypothetical protein
MRSICFAVLAVMLVLAVPAYAQTNPIPAGKSFTVGFVPAATGEAATGWRCFLNGKALTPDLPAASRACVYPGQVPGTYTIDIAGVNAFGEGAKGTLTATAGNPPGAPTNLTITVQVAVQQTGDVTLLTASVAREP